MPRAISYILLIGCLEWLTSWVAQAQAPRQYRDQFFMIYTNCHEEETTLGSLLFSSKEEGKVGFQSGFRYEGQGFDGIMVSLHSVAGCKAGAIWAKRNDRKVFYDLEIVAVDIQHDIAVVSSPELTEEPSRLSAATSLKGFKGGSAIIYGSEVNLRMTVDKELDVSEEVKSLEDYFSPGSKSLQKLKDRESPKAGISVLGLGGGVRGGYSGGAVIMGERGNTEVMGVVMGGLVSVNDLNWAIPMSSIKLKRKEDLSPTELKIYQQLTPATSNFLFNTTYLMAKPSLRISSGFPDSLRLTLENEQYKIGRGLSKLYPSYGKQTIQLNNKTSKLFLHKDRNNKFLLKEKGNGLKLQRQQNLQDWSLGYYALVSADSSINTETMWQIEVLPFHLKNRWAFGFQFSQFETEYITSFQTNIRTATGNFRTETDRYPTTNSYAAILAKYSFQPSAVFSPYASLSLGLRVHTSDSNEFENNGAFLFNPKLGMALNKLSPFRLAAEVGYLNYGTNTQSLVYQHLQNATQTISTENNFHALTIGLKATFQVN